MPLTRREILLGGIAAPAAFAKGDRRPVGLELYTVREALAADLFGTLERVAAMGFATVEFFAPYYRWSDAYAKRVRARLDDLGLACLSTHSHQGAFEPDGRGRAVELNGILGSKNPILAIPDVSPTTVAGWESFTELLADAHAVFRRAGMRGGFHNHRDEWLPLADGGGLRHGMDVIARGTPHDFTLQLDVCTCTHKGGDPVAWIKEHPGRTRSIHLKDWAPGEESDEKGYRVLLGEGVAPWKEIFAAAESVGGVELYLIEQEGSRFSEMETARRCLDAFRSMRA